jgi:UDP-glucose 4-epimerase
LRDRGAAVTVVDRSPSPEPDVTSVVGELTDPATLHAASRDGLDGVFHLAAMTSVLKSIEDPARVYESNVAATAALLELARTGGIGRFLLASTNAVVGDVGDATISEDSPMRPLTPYGATKAACEMLLSGYAGSYGLAASALRLTNVYGPGMSHKDSFVPRLMRAARSGAVVQVYGDGTQRRDLVHVDDVVQGFLLAYERRFSGTVIIGSGRSVSVLELLEQTRQVTGRPLPAEHVPAKAGEMPAVVVEISRARALGYEPTVALEQGLKSVWSDLGGADDSDDSDGTDGTDGTRAADATGGADGSAAAGGAKAPGPRGEPAGTPGPRGEPAGTPGP